MEKKERVLIRFRPEIYECFELEAAYEGLRVGTIANRLLISEIKKVARVGKGHCVVSGSEEDMAIPEGKKTRVLCTASEQRCNRIPAGANREARRKANQ